MSAAKRTIGSSRRSVRVASRASLTCPPRACGLMTNPHAARPARKNCWNGIWRSSISARLPRPIARIQPHRWRTKMPVDHQLCISAHRTLSHSVTASSLDHRALSAGQTVASPANQRSACSADSQPSVAQALAPCVYLAFRCTSCGDVRQALPQLPSADSVSCPECGHTCGFVLLGSGFTKRPLPFHEIHPVERMPPVLPVGSPHCVPADSA